MWFEIHLIFILFKFIKMSKHLGCKMLCRNRPKFYLMIISQICACVIHRMNICTENAHMPLFHMWNLWIANLLFFSALWFVNDSKLMSLTCKRSPVIVQILSFRTASCKNSLHLQKTCSTPTRKTVYVCSNVTLSTFSTSKAVFTNMSAAMDLSFRTLQDQIWAYARFTDEAQDFYFK